MKLKYVYNFIKRLLAFAFDVSNRTTLSFGGSLGIHKEKT
jgi:hypothetical protein